MNEKADFNTVLASAIEQQKVQEELDKIAKQLGDLELEKQRLLNEAFVLNFRLKMEKAK